MTLLWHGPEPDPVTGETAARPIGICVFVSPPMSLGPRNQFFGRRGRWTSLNLKAMNRQLCLLQRVVLHPTYRGAGIAAAFIRRSCELCPFPWIETLTQLGNTHPVFERAGFQRVGPVRRTSKQTRASHAQIFGRRCPDGSRTITRETFEKSRFSRPVYYVFDNRPSCECLNPTFGECQREDTHHDTQDNAADSDGSSRASLNHAGSGQLNPAANQTDYTD